MAEFHGRKRRLVREQSISEPVERALIREPRCKLNLDDVAAAGLYEPRRTFFVRELCQSHLVR